MTYEIILPDGDHLVFEKVGQVIHHLGTNQYFKLESTPFAEDGNVKFDAHNQTIQWFYYAIEVYPAEVKND